MLKYIAKRLGQSIIVLIGVTLFVFIILHLTGDPVAFLLEPGATQEAEMQLRESLGLDKPFAVQYLIFLRNAFTGNFGNSYYFNEPAMQLVLERMPATLLLASASLLVAVIWSIPAGIISAVKRNSLVDMGVRTFSLLGQSLPSFWLGLLLMLLFSVKLKWFPTYGYGSIRNLVMPVIALATHSASSITRLMRSGMLDILGKEYITAAKAKGVSNAVLIGKHALKNSISSVITIIGMQFATLMGGSIVVENVFSWPGVGKLLVQSITSRDFMVVEAGVFLIAVFFITINLIVDISYALINPRIRYE